MYQVTEEDFVLVQRKKRGEVRVVHTQRKRKLRKRGVYCWWSHCFNAWIWEPAPQEGGE
jgi:hypothetical protein